MKGAPHGKTSMHRLSPKAFKAFMAGLCNSQRDEWLARARRSAGKVRASAIVNAKSRHRRFMSYLREAKEATQ